MKVYQLLQSFDFNEIFPEVNKMFPNARLYREVYANAFKALCEAKSTASKKTVKYKILTDPDTNEMFYGADDNDFNGPWDVILGKEIKKDGSVDLNDTEMAANCLINLIMISRHPQSFDEEYRKLMK